MRVVALACSSVKANFEVRSIATFGGLDLGNVDVEVADRIALELLLSGLVAFDLGQAGDPVALQATMQRRSRQPRDCHLQRVEAVVERQQRVSAEGDNDRLLLDRQHRRFRILRTGWPIGNRGALLPLGDGLRVDPVAPGQRPQALLTVLYRSTDRLCRRGAAVKNLAHSASLHSRE